MADLKNLQGKRGGDDSAAHLKVKSMTRTITTHEVNGLNESLLIAVLDEPGHGGACHEYQIRRWVRNTGDENDDAELCLIQFQNGPIKEHGVNGISNEALLAIVRDRLECFQAGQYACGTNEQALNHVVSAMVALASRTRERAERGVEGTHQK